MTVDPGACPGHGVIQVVTVLTMEHPLSPVQFYGSVRITSEISIASSHLLLARLRHRQIESFAQKAPARGRGELVFSI